VKLPIKMIKIGIFNSIKNIPEPRREGNGRF
jgi:hypothetical protein